MNNFTLCNPTGIDQASAPVAIRARLAQHERHGMTVLAEHPNLTLAGLRQVYGLAA